MKIKCLVIISFLISNSVYSQSIDLADLYTYVRYTENQFHDAIFQKGFIYSKPVNESSKEGQIYIFDGYHNGIKRQTYVAKLSKLGSSYVNAVEVQTNNEEIYQIVQTQMKVFPFEYLKTENNNGVITAYYRSIEASGKVGMILYFTFDPSMKGIFIINLSLGPL